jgi:outer membrane autotransporter protein
MRMQALQSGATGFSAMGLHVTDNSNTDLTAGYAGPSGPEGKGGKEVVPPPVDNRWGTFITGAGEFDRVGDTQTARGFNLDSGGITLGVDFRFTDHFVAGIFAGYTYTGIDISDGRIAVDTGKFGIYATYFDGGFYVNSAVQGGYDGYETNRTSLGGIAHSSPTGGDFNLLFAPGYNWTVGGLTFGPTSRFQYSYESVNGFTESGSLAPLTVGSQHTESIVSAFGVKASYDWKVGTTIIRPELRLEWEHEYGDVATSIASQLASGAGNSFTVTGPEIGRDDMHLGAGVSVVFSDRLTAYVYYDGQYFRTNYDSSTVTGGFRFLF